MKENLSRKVRYFAGAFTILAALSLIAAFLMNEAQNSKDAVTMVPANGAFLVEDAVIYYTVGADEDVFSISEKFGLRPDTIILANREVFESDPDLPLEGIVLRILPVDGIYYLWENGDTLVEVAERYGVAIDDITLYGPNREIVHPSIGDFGVKPGDWIIIPGGQEDLAWSSGMIVYGENSYRELE